MHDGGKAGTQKSLHGSQASWSWVLCVFYVSRLHGVSESLLKIVTQQWGVEVQLAEVLELATGRSLDNASLCRKSFGSLFLESGLFFMLGGYGVRLLPNPPLVIDDIKAPQAYKPKPQFP